MPYQELPGLGMRGLNTDTPPQALDHTQFSAGNNMRPFDGSLQTVFSFGGNETNISPASGANPSGDRRDVFQLSGWIETGADELRVAYIWQDADDDYHVQIIDDLTTSGNFISGADAETMLTDNPRWGQQMLAFNGVLIVNDSVNQPIVVFKNSEDNYVAQFVQGWLSQDADNPDTEQAPVATRVTCERIIPYNGRLVALNLDGDYLEDYLGNASIVWSTPIDELGSLNNVTFRFSATNSAGDDILTETPGEVVDGGACGQYLIIYKDDAVYRYVDTGAPLYLVGEPIYTDDGLYAPDCFVDIGGGRHVMLGNYGVYIHDGGPNRQNISRGRIQTELYSEILENRKDDVFLFHNTNDKEVWICIPTVEDIELGDHLAEDDNFEGNWSSTATYNEGDIVFNTHDSKYYVSISQNFGARPDINGGSWDEIIQDPHSGCDKAYVYNYEQDTWYTRDLPLERVADADNYANNGIRGITQLQKDGQLWTLAFSNNGVFRLNNERFAPDSLRYESGNIEMHYLAFGDHSKVKHLHEVYPHTVETVEVNVQTTNKLNPDPPSFNEEQDRVFNPAEEYKLDYRVHGRYYHIQVLSNGNSNPQLTNMGFELKLGGDR